MRGRNMSELIDQCTYEGLLAKGSMGGREITGTEKADGGSLVFL